MNDNLQKMTADVFISGGGPVGLMLALGLAQQNYQVVLAEPFPVNEDDLESTAKNSFDGRVLALSKGSQKFLQKLGLWTELSPKCTAIEHIHVSQKGYLGLTTLHADEVDVDALGFSIKSSDLGLVLWRNVNATENITTFTPAKLSSFEQNSQKVTVTVEAVAADQETEQAEQSEKANIVAEVTVDLIVGADGTNSKVRQILNLPLEEKFYDAYGVLAQIETEQHPQGWAYERFTENGPVALLPLNNHFHKAVMVVPSAEVERVQALNDKEYLNLFADKMGERLGAFTKVSDRVVYPLKESYAPQMSLGRALLMGNASHTQHPVAAQGLNLGIRDIEVFLALCERHADSPSFDMGAKQLLHDYVEQREPDHKKVMGLTDTLIQVFQHQSPIVGHLRGIGMMAMQAMPSVKKRFSKFAMHGYRKQG